MIDEAKLISELNEKETAFKLSIANGNIIELKYARNLLVNVEPAMVKPNAKSPMNVAPIDFKALKARVKGIDEK